MGVAVTTDRPRVDSRPGTGEDRFGHFDLEPRPRTDFDPECVAYHKAMLERATRILYSGADKVKWFDEPQQAAGM